MAFGALGDFQRHGRVEDAEGRAQAESLCHRVLMTADTVGGVWTFALELAEGLAANGVQVLLAALGGEPSEAQRAAAERIPNLRLFTSKYKLEWMEDPWPDVEESGRWLLDLARRYEPDVIHLNSYGHGALRFDCPVLLTAHSCVLSWWAAVRGGEAPAEWDRYRELVIHSLENATVVSAPSRAMAAALEKHYGFARWRCKVIPNGRKRERFRAVEKEPFIFAAGRLRDEGKNAAALTAIAPELSWPVYAAGDWDGPGALGFLSEAEIAGWYSRAAIYALPARYEPFGLSVLEAALSRCALLLGDIPGLREIWGDAALFAPPEDQGALRVAIEMLIDNRELREEYSRRSYQRALAYSAERMLEGYQDIYKMAVTAGALG